MQNSNDGFGKWFPIRKGDFSITESFTLNHIPPLMERTSSHHSTHFIPTKKKKGDTFLDPVRMKCVPVNVCLFERKNELIKQHLKWMAILDSLSTVSHRIMSNL